MAKAEAEKAAAAIKAAEAEKAAKAALAEDNKVTGFHQLPNPFPDGPADAKGEYLQVGPSATDLLAQARQLAIETASGLSDSVKAKYNVGRLLGLSSLGDSSTDDYTPQMYDYDDGAQGSGGNPYAGRPGLTASAAGATKIAALERDIQILFDKGDARDGQLQVLEEHLAAVAEATKLKGEVAELRAKQAFMEKKMAMLEGLLLDSPGDNAANEGKLARKTEVRLIARAGFGGGGGARSKPSVKDLARTDAVGTITLLKNSMYSDARQLILDDFDEDICPSNFKFYELTASGDDLLMVHEKQEGKVPVVPSVLYLWRTGASRPSDGR